MKFEEGMEKLEGIIHQLEEGNLPLEESLEKFEEGMKLINFCEKKLEEVEKRVNILTKDQDKFKLEPWQPTTEKEKGEDRNSPSEEYLFPENS